jgi:hypothetical protein
LEVGVAWVGIAQVGGVQAGVAEPGFVWVGLAQGSPGKSVADRPARWRSVRLRCSRPLAGALTIGAAGYLLDIAVIASLQRRSGSWGIERRAADASVVLRRGSPSGSADPINPLIRSWVRTRSRS